MRFGLVDAQSSDLLLFTKLPFVIVSLFTSLSLSLQRRSLLDLLKGQQTAIRSLTCQHMVVRAALFFCQSLRMVYAITRSAWFSLVKEKVHDAPCMYSICPWRHTR